MRNKSILLLVPIVIISLIYSATVLTGKLGMGSVIHRPSIESSKRRLYSLNEILTVIILEIKLEHIPDALMIEMPIDSGFPSIKVSCRAYLKSAKQIHALTVVLKHILEHAVYHSVGPIGADLKWKIVLEPTYTPASQTIYLDTSGQWMYFQDSWFSIPRVLITSIRHAAKCRS